MLAETRSTAGLWAGKSTATVLEKTPSACALFTNAFSVTVSPDRTTERGPLTAARATASDTGAINRRASAASSSNIAIEPLPSRSARALLRATTTAAASSRESPPAAKAAATSPKLCPITAPGAIPCSPSRAVIATWYTNIDGWTTSVLPVRKPDWSDHTGGPPAVVTACAAARAASAKHGKLCAS
jgi:hypothetical protein